MGWRIVRCDSVIGREDVGYVTVRNGDIYTYLDLLAEKGLISFKERAPLLQKRKGY